MSKTVKKALSPEEVSVLENIGSLVNQLKSSGAGASEDDVMMAYDEELDMVKKEDIISSEEEEEDVMKESNGPTANPEDKAEDRVEEPTDITAGNLSEVGKSLNALVRAINGGQTVQKSAPKRRLAPKSNNDVLVMKSIAEISKVMKSLADQQNTQNLAIQNILDGIGFTENVQKSLAVQKSKSSAPIGNLDGTQVLAELTSVLKGLQNGNNDRMGENRQQWSGTVQKSRTELANALPALFGITN